MRMEEIEMFLETGYMTVKILSFTEIAHQGESKCRKFYFYNEFVFALSHG